MIKKLWVSTIIILLIGMSVVSSTGKNVDNYIDNSNLPVAVDNSERLLACNHKAYIGGDHPLHEEAIYEFILNDPGNLTNICFWDIPINFASSGAWTNDQRLIVVDYSNGALYEIDIETCEIKTIGGGGVGLNGLTYDPIDKTLYGCSSYDLYKIDEEGNQELVGSFGTGETHIEIACDSQGNMYTWDVKFSGDSYLYKVDKETGLATVVGSLGMTLLYSQDGDFCKKDDILYLATYVSSPFEGNYLYECDKETANCTLVGEFDIGEISFFVIPEKNLLPIADFNWTPTFPDPGETIIFNASDSYDPDGYIKLYEWDWDNDGEYDYKNFTSPIAAHIFEEEGYYPVTLRVHDHNFSNDTITKTVRVGNQQPSPPIIKGPIQGKVGVEYDYTFNSTDDDNDDLVYVVDWGDDSPLEYIGPSPPGEEVNASHTWYEAGTYPICAKSIDEFGLESPSGYLLVTIPRNKIYHNILFLRFFERFTFLQRILNIMGWYN